MYESYSRQELPSKQYRELLGAAISVFNSNNQFIIENILSQKCSIYTWHKLIDKTSGELSTAIKQTITLNSDTKIADLFFELVLRRNRIVHSFQVTHNNEQILATKNNAHEQFIITEEYLLEFIKGNEQLSSLLHAFRGY